SSMSETIPTTEISEENAQVIQRILPKIAQLEAALLAEAPGIRNHLQDINDDLKQYPDVVMLLSDEQIAPIYHALRAHTNVEIAARAAKKSKKATKEEGQFLADLL